MRFTPVIKDVLFLLVLTIICAIYYDGILHKGPLGDHAWRQADCLSLTQHYAEGSPFLEPEMHFLRADELTSGKTAGEFPIMYYAVGKIWSAVGKSYFSYRIFYLIITVFALFLLYKAILIALRDWVWSAFITLLVFTSPNFVMYATSFLTDAPAICFVFISLYFLARYASTNHLKWFYFSMAFFALAGLIKVSALIAFIFLLFIFVIERLPVKSLGDRRLFARPIAEGLGFGGVFIFILLWYAYANHYNGIHDFKYTFNSIYPMWKIPGSEVNTIFEGIKNNTRISFFSRTALFALLFISIFNLFLFRRINFFAYAASLIISVGCIAYFILWFPLMQNHSYYFIILVILVPAILTPFALFLKNVKPGIYKGKTLRILLLIFLLYNIIYSKEVVTLSLKGEDKPYHLVNNDAYVTYMRYLVWSHNFEWRRFERMKPYLLEIGVEEKAKVISIPDASFNISLYYSDHKGWTNFMYLDEVVMDTLIEKGAQYLFVSDKSSLQEEFLKPYLTDQIGSFEGIDIFKLGISTHNL